MMSAFVRLTRRGFFGQMAGAYAATNMIIGTGSFSVLDMLIERHRMATLRMCEAGDRCDEHSTPETVQTEVEAVRLQEVAYEALLRHRPADLDETGRKLAYLTERSGPWYGCIPDEWEIKLFVQSILPETV